MKRSAWLSGTLALASIALSLAVAELAVRVAFPRVARGNFTAVSKAIKTESPWPEVPYLLKPGAEVGHFFHSDPRGYFGPDATLTYRINALGFRGPEARVEKPPGTFRILGLGDSFTFGTGVREEDTFLAVLRERLAARGDTQVWNLGVMGFDTPQEVALLLHVGLDFDPDLVLITFFLNDAAGTPIHAAFDPGPEAWELPAWRRHSALADRVATFLERRRAERELVEETRASFADDAPGWERVRQALRRARATAVLRDFEVALVIFPMLYRLSDGYPFAGVHDTVSAWARAEGLPVLDLRFAFAGHDGPELWVHPSNQHPNEIGHAIAAEAIEAFLIERGWAPAAGPG